MKRNISVDILKCIAAFSITFSHMGKLCSPYEFIATGGTIGNALFFFCSGFTLFMKPMGRFDNWYKRRINRIYPTIFVIAIFSCLFFGENSNILSVISIKGYWFIQCIMIYYVLIWIVNRYISQKIWLAYVITAVASVLYFCYIDRPLGFSMYLGGYCKWFSFFLFMLLGATLGSTNHSFKYELKTDGLKLIISFALYHIILFLSKNYEMFKDLQILSVIPLLLTTFYAYKVCNSYLLKKIYNNKCLGNFINFIGGLCLEIYVVQNYLFTISMNKIFPANIIIMYIIIFVVAYIIRCFSRFLSQTFKEESYNWQGIIKLI